MSDLHAMTPFWMVHGDGPTNYRHATRAAAIAEAERLARHNPGTVFVVTESVEAIRKTDLERVTLRPFDHDDRPF